ncbi:MAG TPA: hypothetical protein VJ648_05380 [Vicinamibacteria bacterium]|nr:hypothetical protein [Vicinamibacteria bacterium]
MPTAPQDPVQAELDVARAATARYQDVSVALQEGFVADPVCVSSPLGTMGVHYVNPSRSDARVTAGEPEILLYLPEGGRMRLVAIEYSMPIAQNGQPYFGATPPTNPGTTPVLFGQSFDGPMAGHGPAQPWHFDLHVWIWAENPAGRFAQFNAQLRCP